VNPGQIPAKARKTCLPEDKHFFAIVLTFYILRLGFWQRHQTSPELLT
jgi:hypothetical protein